MYPTIVFIFVIIVDDPADIAKRSPPQNQREQGKRIDWLVPTGRHRTKKRNVAPYPRVLESVLEKK
jgi:hypothetical protein